MAPTEVWRTIPGYEGRYEASSHGRIRSLGFWSGNRFNTQTWRAGRVLKPAPLPSGHLNVSLVDANGRQNTRRVHRLVLLAFVGPPPVGSPNGLHRNDVPWNNEIGNLYWGSHTENSVDALRNGTHTQSSKITCGLGHELIEPNLVPSSSRKGFRGCLACKLARACHNHDEKLRATGRERTRYNRGKDGFLRLQGESFEAEADRRYAHILGHSL